jgi:histone deacetylase 1/2
VLVYVDDIIVTELNHSVIISFIDSLKDQFHIQDLGQLSYFLGVEAQRNNEGLHLRQAKYISDLLDSTKMQGAKPLACPTTSGMKLSLYDGTLLPDSTEYRRVMDALQYCTISRPDISYAVNQLCQFMHNLEDTHWMAIKRVLRYLKGTVDYGLYYAPSTLDIHVFCDSDWAGNPDDRRSTSGFIIFLEKNLISWCAMKQGVVSRSSTEAEYQSMALATAEAYWIRMLIKDFQLYLYSPPIIWRDNIGALTLASNPVFHTRTKHVEIDYHFMREKVVNKDILVKHFSTKDQLADIFTKGLTTTRF